MSDISVQRGIIRAVSVSITTSGLQFSHYMGEISLSWASISHVFGVILEKKNAPALPLVLLLTRDSQDLLCIDGFTTTFKNFKSQRSSKSHKGKYQSHSELRKAREEVLPGVIKEICSHLSSSYIGKPLVEYLKGSNAFLPTFSKLRDIIEYCRRAAERVTEGDMMGAHSLDTEAELPLISISRPEREEWKEGSVIEGQYTVQQILRGAMGTVYIVFNSQHARYCAMKTFQEKHLWDKNIVDRFIREAEIWIKLGRHPNIVQAELVREIEGKHYIVLEYVQGTDLEELMENEPLSLTRAVNFGIQFSEGMDYAFKKVGLIHRDIKPSNCLITREGLLKITDFGLGKVFDESPAELGLISIPRELGTGKIEMSSSGATSIVGTLAFMAPELFVDMKSAGVRSDIYAFGIVLYLMTAGINPFYDAEPLRVIDNHLSKDPPSPGTINAKIPEPLAKLILKCIRKDPEERYESFENLKTELEKVYAKLCNAPYRSPEIKDIFTEDDWLNKGLSLASLNRHREAVLNFEQALNVNSKSVSARIYMASSLIQLKEFEESLRRSDEALEYEGENWRVWFNKGEAWWKAGNMDKALACFDRALDHSDDSGTILGRKGKIFYEAGNLREAQIYYDRALSQSPRSAETWDDMAVLNISIGSYEAAMKCLEKSLEINPRSGQALYHQGITLFNMGCFPEAVRALQRALTINPDFPESWLYIGDCYRESGHGIKALEAYRTALDIQPKNMEAYLSCIMLLKEKRQLEEALKLTDRALLFEPENIELLFHRGEILFELGYLEEARSCGRKVKELDPEHKHILLLVNTSTRWIEERDGLFSMILSSAPLSREFCLESLNTLLSVFCDSGDALAYIEEKPDGSPRENYLRACLSYLEGNSEKAIECINAALCDPAMNAASLNLKSLVEAQIERKKTSGEKKQSLLGSLFRKKEHEMESLFSTPDEFLLSGIDKIKRNMLKEAKENLRSACTLDDRQTAAVYFMGQAFELEGILDSARQCYDTFIKSFPGSYGWLRDRLLEPALTSREREHVFHRMLAVFPDDYRQWIHYIRSLTGQKSHEKVRLIASRLLAQWEKKNGGKNPRFWNFKGLLQLFLSRNEEARSSFTEALESAQENAAALIGMAISYEKDGLSDRALQHLAKLPEPDGNEIAAYLQAGILEKQGFSKKPLQALESALEKNPDSLILLYKKAQFLYHAGDYENFFNLCTRIGAIDPAFAPVKILRAMSLAEVRQKTSDAFAELNNVLSCERENSVAMRNLGFMYLKFHKSSSAMKTFDHMLSIYRLDYLAYMGKGMAGYLTGDYRMAHENFFQAIQLNHMDPDLWQFMGAVNFHLKHFDDSRDCWDKALRYRSGFLQAWINKGNFLYQRGEYIQAQELANRALRINPKEFSAWLLRARCQWKRGDLREAVKSAERSLSISPENFSGWVLRGILEFQNKNYEQSLRSFEKGSTLEQRQAEIWYNRGLVGMHLKNYAEARKSLERALALNPDHFASLIVRFFLGKETGDQAAAKSYLLHAQQKDPERFLVWFSEFEQSRHPLSILIPLEPPGDPFTLPFDRPLTFIEPFELFDLVTG